MAKKQGTEDEGAGSVLKYMTKPESDSNAADWLIMTHRLVLRLAKIVIFPFFREKQASFVVFASLKGWVGGKGRTERGQRCLHWRLHTNDFQELLYVASRTLCD